MTRIGVISDTHMPPTDEELCRRIEERFSGVDLILHAGDIVTLRVLDWLETIAPVRAAIGNNDIRLDGDPRLAPYQRLTIDGLTIGMLHILDPLEWPLPRLAERYRIGELPDVLIFGDTHFDYIAQRENTLLINPGSPTSPRMRTDLPGTVALLTIESGRAQAEIITLDR